MILEEGREGTLRGRREEGIVGWAFSSERIVCVKLYIKFTFSDREYRCNSVDKDKKETNKQNTPKQTKNRKAK